MHALLPGSGPEEVKKQTIFSSSSHTSRDACIPIELNLKDANN